MREEPSSDWNPQFIDDAEMRLRRMSAITWHGDFELTHAVRPLDRRIKLREGYRRNIYQQRSADGSLSNMPMITAAATRRKLYDLFLDLVEVIGNEVSVILVNDHTTDKPVSLSYRHVDNVVLRSLLWDYRKLLLDDGRSGIAVLREHDFLEVYLSEYKHLRLYGSVAQFEPTLRGHGLREYPQMKFIHEARPARQTEPYFIDEFARLTHSLEKGFDETDDPFSYS